MKSPKYYFVVWESKEFSLGIQICVYDSFSINIQLPFLDIRLGFSYDIFK